MRFNNKNVILPELWQPAAPPLGEIWYTTTDGNISGDASSLPGMVSNTYENGKGVIKFEGDSIAIGGGAFSSNLKTIKIPQNVASFKYNSFSGADNLIEVYWNAAAATAQKFNYYYLFSGSPIERCYFGPETRTIPQNIFNSTESYAKTDETLKTVVFMDGVTSIGGGTFNSCRRLTSIEIPNSVTSIGYQAFSGCSGLTSVTIGNSVTSIGYEAFYNCSSLEYVTIYSNNIEILPMSMFKGCSSLSNFTIPDGVLYLGLYLFENCTNLTSVEIPASVIEFNSSGRFTKSSLTFANCTNLSNIMYKGTISQWNSISKLATDWHQNVPATVVHCTDGDAPI